MTKRTTRLAHGEGSIYYERSRDRYVGSMDLGRDGNGRRLRAKVTGATRDEVALKLRARRAAIEAGDAAPSAMTVAALLDQWEGTVVARMTPRTAEHARWALAHVRPVLGTVRLVDLRASHVEAMLAAKATEGLSRSTVTRVRATLARALKWGQARDYVARNAADLAEMPPTPPPAEGRALTRTELAALLTAAEGSRLGPVWVLMGELGLRPGEAVGLTWPDIDLEGAVVHVRRHRKLREGTVQLGELKTARSRRSLAMSPGLTASMRSHRARWLEERLLLGAAWLEEWAELVFTTEAGTPVDPSNLRRELDRLTRTAGIGHLRPYDLRHTAATLMAEAGTPLELIADVLGHSGIAMARAVYTHATARTITAAADAVARTADGA